MAPRERRSEPGEVPAPTVRLRRLRRTAELRDLFAEPSFELSRLIYPVFVRPGAGDPEPIPSMPGVERYPLDRIPSLARSLAEEGIRAVLLFGLPRKKDAEGSEAWSAQGAVPRAIPLLRKAAPGLVVFTDVCLCAYTSHGHCGLVRRGEIDNDATLDRLGRVALAHAEAGADLVAPSAMMDGQVAALRAALDRGDRAPTGILAYAAKFASSFYGPFREAEESRPESGDRRSHQFDPRNGREALAGLARAAEEGADALMVKPALPYLDVIARARLRFSQPLVAYQVSGEYSMIKAAAERGWIDEPAAIAESLTAIRRAGADLTITYFARDVAQRSRGVR